MLSIVVFLNCIWLFNFLLLIFTFATLIASSETSIAVILALINSLANEIARAPDPVPISNILILQCLFLINFKLSSINPSVSGLGSKTNSLT